MVPVGGHHHWLRAYTLTLYITFVLFDGQHRQRVDHFARCQRCFQTHSQNVLPYTQHEHAITGTMVNTVLADLTQSTAGKLAICLYQFTTNTLPSSMQWTYDYHTNLSTCNSSPLSNSPIIRL